MNTYIAILRGINVSGKNKIAMVDLRKVLEKAGLKQIQTYIQSGNVIFRTEPSHPRDLAIKIETEIQKHWGFQVPIIVLGHEELSHILADNPFQHIGDPALLHITFLSEVPQAGYSVNIASVKYPPDAFEIKGRAIYLYCPAGYGKTKFNTAFFENKLKVSATTRNLNTSISLAEIAKKLTERVL
jgi:uncharacterized protein (DUF1697 family)